MKAIILAGGEGTRLKSVTGDLPKPMVGLCGKPVLEHIFDLLKRNGITDAVYVGDTEGDEKAARYAKIPFIWAAYGFGKANAPDDSIAVITDLPACLKKLMNKG